MKGGAYRKGNNFYALVPGHFGSANMAIYFTLYSEKVTHMGMVNSRIKR